MMRMHFSGKLAFLTVAVLLSGTMTKASLKVGNVAPDFALPDQRGNLIRLSDFRGKRAVVLVFYVRAGTPG